ncbi:MAG: peptidylprolyl isomerase [Christensenellaceae bacterium]|nr:peptidylprolyl isomerase [Christensenellaceae bacterium]
MKVRRLLSMILVLLTVLTMTGCNMVFVNEELDKEQIIAVVNGVEIKKEDLIENYEAYKASYGITAANEKSDAMAETVKNLKIAVFDELVRYEVIYQKAVELGLDKLTAKQEQELDKVVTDRQDFILATVTQEVEDEMELNPGLDKDAEIARRVEEQYEAIGMKDGSFRERKKRDFIVQNLKDYLAKDYVVPEDQLQLFYDENLEAQVEDLSGSPKNLPIYESLGYSLYVPKGLRYVKNLLVALPEDVQDELSRLRFEGKDEEADKLQADELAKIKGKADDIYAKLQAGEDYDALLAEYGEDPGMAEKPQGYRIFLGMEDYDEKFVNGGMELEKIGDYSEPIASDFGYYILQYAADEPHGVKSFEETKAGFYDIVKEELIDSVFEETVTKWTEEADVTKHEDLIF